MKFGTAQIFKQYDFNKDMYTCVLWLRKVSMHETMQGVFSQKKARTKGMVPFCRHRCKLQVKEAIKSANLPFGLCKHATGDASAATALDFAQQDGAAGKDHRSFSH